MAGQLQFDRILNLRDVGQAINELNVSPCLKPGVLFRSARPDEASASDRDLLRTALNIHTVIDLRSATEHTEQAQKLHPPSSPPSPIPPITAYQIPGLIYTHISLNGPSFTRALLLRLPYLSLLKLLALYAFNYRLAAISILGTLVLAPRGLTGLAVDTLANSTAEIRAVFAVLAEQAAWPVLVHCTQGKDRTGLVVLLALLLCGVSRADIDADYRRSERELAPELQERLREIASIGLGDEFATCPEDWVESVCRHVDEAYGGVEKYLLLCGVGEDMQTSVRRALLVDE